MDLLRNPYAIKDGVVYWSNKEVPRASADTFRWLGGDWARDARGVYVQNALKKGIDADSFEYLNPVYGKDRTAAYDWIGPIKGATPEAFEALDPGIVVQESLGMEVWARGYARDVSSVYYHDQMFGRATALKGADPGSFVSLRNDYGLDAQGVWYQKKRLPGAKPASWAHLGRLWSTDGDRVYFVDREVEGVKLDRFMVVGAPTVGSWATDGESYFLSDTRVSEQEFWAGVASDFAGFETGLRAAFHRIQKTCSTCSGSGDCYCVRKGGGRSDECARCEGSGRCHVCKGRGRLVDPVAV